jgi:phosphonate transport system substrate-binding protein
VLSRDHHPRRGATEQVRKFGPIAAYLEKKLGMKVEFTPVSDYPAAVESAGQQEGRPGLVRRLHLRAGQIRSGGKIIPLAQREEDTRFQSVFIAKTDSGIKTLADLKGKQVSFGSQSSTSGHLMPRTSCCRPGINPEKDFRRVAYSGAHDATIASVVSGKVHAAALDITVWRSSSARTRSTPRRSTCSTPPALLQLQLVGACRHAGRPARKVQKAAARLDPATPEGKPRSCTSTAPRRYIPTTPENYKGIEAAGRSAGLI